MSRDGGTAIAVCLGVAAAVVGGWVGSKVGALGGWMVGAAILGWAVYTLTQRKL